MKIITLALTVLIPLSLLGAEGYKLPKTDPTTGELRGFDEGYYHKNKMCNYKKFPRQFVKMEGTDWDVYIDTEYEKWAIHKEFVVEDITKSLKWIDKNLPKHAINWGKQKYQPTKWNAIPLKTKSMSEEYGKKPPKQARFKIFVMLGKRSKMQGSRSNGYEYVGQGTTDGRSGHTDPRYPTYMERGLVMHCGEQILRDAHSKNLTSTIIHEYSHFYHYNAFGSWHPPIEHAFNVAQQNGLYKRTTGAGTNSIEYFAEISTKYWYQRCVYFPFTRKHLKAYDKVGFNMVKNLWNFKDLKDSMIDNNEANAYVLDAPAPVGRSNESGLPNVLPSFPSSNVIPTESLPIPRILNRNNDSRIRRFPE